MICYVMLCYALAVLYYAKLSYAMPCTYGVLWDDPDGAPDALLRELADVVAVQLDAACRGMVTVICYAVLCCAMLCYAMIAVTCYDML
jgi:hypothetical protein